MKSTPNPIDNRPASEFTFREVRNWAPTLRHIHRVVKKNPNALVLFRHGNLFEAFFDSALVVGKELALATDPQSVHFLSAFEPSIQVIYIPSVGIPRQSLQRHVNTLLDIGHTVALVDDGPEVKNRQVTRFWFRRDEELFEEEGLPPSF